MWKEIPYFRIEGAFGGNQDWFTNIVMNMGGCGAATACDCCIYFARFLGLKELYPFDIDALSIQDYKDFSQIADLQDSYLALDDIETGSRNRIPLWMFGFLY